MTFDMSRSDKFNVMIVIEDIADFELIIACKIAILC